MYKAVVRRKVRALFDAVNRGDAEPVLAAFAPQFEHAFLGQSALGGARHTLATPRVWYQRYFIDYCRISISIFARLSSAAVLGIPS